MTQSTNCVTVYAEGPMRAQVGKFTLPGDGLCAGYDKALLGWQITCKRPATQVKGGFKCFQSY
jgi:hypothetical protein